MTLTTRIAASTDRDLLNMLHRMLYQEYRGRIMPSALAMLYAYRDFTDVLRQDVAAMLRDRACALFIAEEDGEACGYITGRVEDTPGRLHDRKGVVQDWYVLDDCRGRGAGRALFDSLADHFLHLGCGVIESATWPFNTSARAIHESLGFHETEIRYRKLL